jgi:hypothetical protein
VVWLAGVTLAFVDRLRSVVIVLCAIAKCWPIDGTEYNPKQNERIKVHDNNIGIMNSLPKVLSINPKQQKQLLIVPEISVISFPFCAVLLSVLYFSSQYKT